MPHPTDKIILYHGTVADFDSFDARIIVDGGFHFGTIDQARMRVHGPDSRLIQAELSVCNSRRSRDTGNNWKTKIASAKAAGFDSIIYLNRYEGIDIGTVLRAASQRVDMDQLSDKELRRFAPELQDSYIVFDAVQIKIMSLIKIQPATKRKTEYCRL